jgi:hypothetical protein
MALGLGRFLGIPLPQNFNTPGHYQCERFWTLHYLTIQLEWLVAAVRLWPDKGKLCPFHGACRGGTLRHADPEHLGLSLQVKI